MGRVPCNDQTCLGGGEEQDGQEGDLFGVTPNPLARETVAARVPNSKRPHLCAEKKDS